ncbi:MAG: hypothetical protein ACR2QJ_17645 [Geminicoccaceae bacterium]
MDSQDQLIDICCACRCDIKTAIRFLRKAVYSLRLYHLFSITTVEARSYASAIHALRTVFRYLRKSAIAPLNITTTGSRPITAGSGN